MRSDMQKVIVERPRWGSSLRSKKTALRIRPIDVYEDFDSGPARAPSRMEEKAFSEHLKPLWRFLRSHLGRPWNKVYSEIRQQISGNGVLGNHVLDHLMWEVDLDCEMVEGVAMTRSFGALRRPAGFYVHPVSGLLFEVPRKRRYLRSCSEPVQTLQTRQGALFERIAETWYRIIFEPTAPKYWKIDRHVQLGVAFPEHLPSEVHQMFRSDGHIAGRVHKQQCNRKELRWISDHIVRAEKGKGGVMRRGAALLVPAGPRDA